MVYRGRPSTGCLKCRKRKIKCDERPDGCLKCTEKGYACPGYEDLLDRFFQDESANVKDKVIKAKAKAIALRDLRDSKYRTKPPKPLEGPPGLCALIEAPLLGPLIDQGINFFMSHYALGLDEPPIQSVSYHRHLSTNGFHPVVATSMTALGLAGIANILRDGYLRKEATRWYSKALNMTNSALAHPAEVKSDNTLLSTILLSVYEQTSNEKSFAAWSNHVEGSASLIRVRGRDQFTTPAARRMYMQIVSLLVMNCMGRGEAIPEFIHEMNKQVVEHEDPKNPMNKFYHLNIKAIDFRAQIINGKLTDLHAILDRALELDALARGIFDDVGSSWDPEVVEVEEGTPNIFGTFYHIYPHHSASQTWNWTRYNRIYFHDIIRNTLILGFSMSPPAFVGSYYALLLEESTRTLYEMQAGILASVPQHLHDTPKISLSSPSAAIPTPTSSNSNQARFIWSNFRNATAPEFPQPSGSTERLPKLRVSGGYSFFWSIYIAGATSIATPKVHEYVLRSLTRLSEEFGVNQAKVLVSALKLKIQMDQNGTQGFEVVPSYLPREGEHMRASDSA
ncbi:uncharacterized protein BDR25DRAFT_343927 [Lindgomyces ingoldianus]|uniref:Uncharacterized protein n=1 Tax=Lindgomyces ingoldianus TaxID=673940 RepID=A0ACB6QSU2_9PLEO|nr:uncharacterized protein BDR25DRAFT_343927 [Lindgomyces ingoldianus]KAF2469147.1 hypothetical protein BDR25DRAFT_343927 [Lindgomyces ingoldianus]